MTAMSGIKDKGLLSSYVVYSLPLLFLVPREGESTQWWPVPGIGPIAIAFFVALFLVALYLYDNLSGGKKMSITLENKVFIFWTLFTLVSIGLVIIGIRPSLDSVGVRLYAGIPPYFLAFIVFLVIRNNKWKIKNYEMVIKVFLLVTLVWAVESFVTWYLGITIPGLNSINHKMGATNFSSGFTNSLHTVSKASLVAVWLCIYMYFKYGLTRYVIFAIANFLLMISTLSRASIIALVFFLVLFTFLSYVRFPSKIITLQTNIIFFLKGVFLVGLLISVIGVGQFVVNNKAMLSRDQAVLGSQEIIDADDIQGILEDTSGFTERFFQYSRAIEVILQYPLGVGAGLGYLMCYSREASVIFVDELRQVEPFFTLSKYYQSGIMGANLQQRKVGSGKAFSIHNTTLNWLLDYGVFGFFLLVCYFYWLVRYYKFYIFLMRKKYNNLGKIFLSLLFCQLSVFLAMQTTIKFQAYWVLVFLFLFSMSIYRGFVEEQRKQLQNQE